MTHFQNRRQAGRKLAQRLGAYGGRRDTLVLALPRGGVPVGYEVARTLRSPLDVLLVRKLGVPGHEDLAMGALASHTVPLLHWDTVRAIGITEQALASIMRRELRELHHREQLYRPGRPELVVAGRTVILTDDGLTSGASLEVAVEALRRQRPRRIVVALPICARAAFDVLSAIADEVLCASAPELFQAVGLWYEDFSEVSDKEAVELLDRSRLMSFQHSLSAFSRT